jgi:hypothetical protein
VLHLFYAKFRSELDQPLGSIAQNSIKKGILKL